MISSRILKNIEIVGMIGIFGIINGNVVEFLGCFIMYIKELIIINLKIE